MVQDQVVPDFFDEIVELGQKVRKEESLLRIFEQANLEIFQES